MNQELQRTLLYYPTITIPTDKWLRQALLYWDQVASIVPESWEETEGYHPDIQFLIRENQFHPIRPNTLANKSYSKVKELEKEFVSIIESDNFRFAPSSKEAKKIDSPIHIDKICENIVDYLINIGLAKKSSRKHSSNWIFFERRTALVYMSVLAKFLADIEPQLTIPSTDVEEYRNLLYYPHSGTTGFSCVEIHIFTMLISLHKIIFLNLTFKKNKFVIHSIA